MSRALIIDLDDTIADTSILAQHRDRRDWKGCVTRLHTTLSFDGLVETLLSIRNADVKIGIVTASVSFYAAKVLTYHKAPYDALVAYHDCSPRKPHPAPITMCLNKLECRPEDSIGVGDAEIDALAYTSAGLTSLGAGWSPHLNRAAPWDKILTSPDEMLQYF